MRRGSRRIAPSTAPVEFARRSALRNGRIAARSQQRGVGRTALGEKGENVRARRHSEPRTPAGGRSASAAGPRTLRDTALWALAIAVALAVAAARSPAQAATYKWVDDKGVVHYTDKIPAEQVNKGSTVLDKQARPVKKIDPAATPEQIRAREAEEENRRLAAKANEEIARRDRALVSSYTTEGEIDLARSRAVGTIDAQIESSLAYTQQLTKRREDLERQKQKLAGKPMPAALEREFEGTDSELEKTAALVDQKRRERAGVVARYDADKVRWRELKSISDANAAAAANAPRSHPGAAPVNGSAAASAGPRK